MKKWPVERSVLGGFAVAMMAILILSGIARLNSGKHDKAVSDVMNAYEGLISIGEIMSSMNHAEEAQHFYLLRGEPGYLKMRDEALATADMATRKSGQILATSEAQDSLYEIQGLIAKRRQTFHDIQVVIDTKGVAAARSQFHQGAPVMAQLANVVDVMTRKERSQLRQRVEDERNQHHIEVVSYGLLNLFLPLFFIFLFLHIRSDMRLRGNTEMALAESRERKELAQDLHDDLAQILAVARIKVVQMLKGNKADGIMPPLQEVNGLVMRANQSVRLLLAQISRTPVDGEGLMQLFNWLTQELRLTHDIDIQVRDDGLLMLVDKQVDIAVFRTVRDLLLNTARSGGKVELSMEHIGSCILITLGEGAGESCLSPVAMGHHEGGIGLDVIGERLRRIGGKMNMDNHPNGGVVFTLRVPARVPNRQQIAV